MPVCRNRVPLLFAPIMAGALLVLTLATAWSPVNTGGSGALSIAALPGAIEHNAPPSRRFRSTNATAVTPRFGSLLLRQTNVFSR